jgi:hypothetical protein
VKVIAVAGVEGDEMVKSLAIAGFEAIEGIIFENWWRVIRPSQNFSNF